MTQAAGDKEQSLMIQGRSRKGEAGMNKYVESVIKYVRETYTYQPEFVQTVEEVLSSVSPVMDAHPEYEKVDLLKRMVEPERMFNFRVCWTDDQGNVHTNRGYRCQFNGAIGPYKAAFASRKM